MDANNTNSPTLPVKKKRSKVPIIILSLIVIVGAYFGARRIIHGIYYVSTDNATVETNNVPVLPRVNGYVDSVMVSDYQEVKRGDVLLVLDDRELQIAVQQAEADLLGAEADLINARAQVSSTVQNKSVVASNAQVQDVRLQKAKNDLTRDEALFNNGAITQKQLDDSKANYQAAYEQYRANVEQVKLGQTQIQTSQAQIKRAEALIKTREAQLEQAKLRLSYARITSPITGRVGKISIQPGQYIQPGQNLFTIVDNTRFWVIANFKETQLGRLQIGQTVKITLDGYKKKTITGTIASFSEATGSKFALLPPDNATGNFVKITQRVPVKIEFNNLEEIRSILKAGMSVSVDVKVK
jgi:membrane fusion protein (multidrug efflux system)